MYFAVKREDHWHLSQSAKSKWRRYDGIFMNRNSLNFWLQQLLARLLSNDTASKYLHCDVRSVLEEINPATVI